MQLARHLLVFALAVVSLIACRKPKGFDQMGLEDQKSGEVPINFVARPPANVGEITTWRTNFHGQVFAAVKTEAPCPRDIHSLSGIDFKKDRIELCFTATPRAEPVPGFGCSPVVYVKYEIMGMPDDVDPKFAFVGSCL